MSNDSAAIPFYRRIEIQAVTVERLLLKSGMLHETFGNVSAQLNASQNAFERYLKAEIEK
jgi:hypothetical protein